MNGEWQTPENVAVVNTGGDEGWPYVTQDRNELWFRRTYLGSPGIYRSVKVNGAWSEAELIVGQFAGEPSVDGDGNIYFVHHFFTADSRTIEADIYIAQRKKALGQGLAGKTCTFYFFIFGKWRRRLLETQNRRRDQKRNSAFGSMDFSINRGQGILSISTQNAPAVGW